MAGFPGFYPQQESYYDGADPWDTPFLPGGAQDSTPYIGSAVPPIQAQQEDSGFNFLPGSVGSSIYDAAKATGVRPQFAMGIANNESSFLPTAFNKTPGSTSQGLFGMTDRAVIDANDYATAHMQPLGNPDRTDPLGESLRGTNYLRMMLDKNNGDEFNAAYDFNQGMNAPDNRPAGDVYANNALNFLPGGKIQTASLKSTGPSGGFGVGGGGGGGSEDTSPSVNQGANERIKMITALQSQASDYKKKALEAQTTAYAPSTLSKGDVFGAVGVPLIATIIGAAMNGKKGAKGGALAGFQGAGAGLKVAEGEAAKKSQLAAEQAKYYNSEGKDLQNQAQQLQSQEFQSQDIKDRSGGKNTNTPEYKTALYQTVLAQHVPEEQAKAILDAPNDFEARLVAGELRRGKESSLNIGQRGAYGIELIDPRIIPSQKDWQIGKQIHADYNIISQSVLPEMRKVWTDPNSTIDQKREVLSNAIVKIKNLDQMGANFTAMEKSLTEAGLPAIQDVTPEGIANWALQAVRGQDPISKINRAMDRFETQVNAKLSSYNMRIVAPQQGEGPEGLGNRPTVAGSTSSGTNLQSPGRPDPKNYSKMDAAKYIADVRAWEASNAH